MLYLDINYSMNSHYTSREARNDKEPIPDLTSIAPHHNHSHPNQVYHFFLPFRGINFILGGTQTCTRICIRLKDEIREDPL